MDNQPERQRQQAADRILVVGEAAEEVVRALEALCFDVELVPSGLHAQRILERDSDVAIVIAEEELPGIDGIGFLMLTRSRWPRVRRVLLTPSLRGALIMEAKMSADARALGRPVTRERLSDVVEQELRAYARGA